MSGEGKREAGGKLRTRLMWTVWALVPAVAVGVHMGVGRELAARDEAIRHIEAARAAAEAEDWMKADEEYGAAIGLMGEKAEKERNQIRIEQAKARMMGGEFLEGQEMLEGMLEEELAREKGDEELVRSLRAEVAASGYYAAWIMRREGASEEEWFLESSKARQNYKFMLEEAIGRCEGDSAWARGLKENLETVHRFERLTHEELMARPCPKECKNCKGLCKKKSQKQSKKPTAPKDDREKAKSAGGASERGKGW